MFHGSIPADMQAILCEIVAEWPVPDIHVGCSGNFTVERVLHGSGITVQHHGNDITLYSCAIGAYLAGTPLTLTLNPEHVDRFGWMQESLENGDPASALATVLLATRVVLCLGKPKNRYYDRLVSAFERQWPTMHEKTAAKVRDCPVRLASFFQGDVAEWIQHVPREHGVICYPPFFGAAKAYQRDFAKLAELILWDPPTFEALDADRLMALFAQIRECRRWVFGSNERLTEYDGFLRGLTKTTNRGLPIYVYAGGGPARIVRPRQETTPVLVPRLGTGDTLGRRMWLAELTTPQFQALRSQYMNPGIRPGQATLPVAVMVDDQLVGVFAFSSAPTHAKWDTYMEGPHVYLLSDFPVAPVSYPRLSKLVLYAALSTEAKLLVERSAHRRYRALNTTAFSNNPVSMKYRGLLKLMTRREREGGEAWAKDISDANGYYQQRYELNYGSALGRWTLAEGLTEWTRKHGQRV